MMIAIGSTNPVKVQAVREAIQDHCEFAHAHLLPFNAPSEISDQPLSLEEIIRGAKNRARNAWASGSSCCYSFGIESGLFEAKGTETGFLEACICCIYDGKRYYTGLSCGFELPPQLLQLILKEKMDLNQACYHSGITENATLGSAEGFVGILTRGRINRKEYTKQCVITALSQLDHAKWYV